MSDDLIDSGWADLAAVVASLSSEAEGPAERGGGRGPDPTRFERIGTDDIVFLPRTGDLGAQVTAAVYEGGGSTIRCGPADDEGWFVVWDDAGRWCAGDAVPAGESAVGEPGVIGCQPGPPVRGERIGDGIRISSASPAAAASDGAPAYVLAWASPTSACLIGSDGRLLAIYEPDLSVTLSSRLAPEDRQIAYLVLGSGLLDHTNPKVAKLARTVSFR
ncbi:MAG: hypothetical protein JWO77_347 [Ilumatobacteraceae bacterium]|nr:hypothetical protein [Ilumatobacteraceae bacterium]